MALSAGIVGLPNVGKSTLFNALTSGKAAAQNYPFCTIDPNHGVVEVPDQRLERIARINPDAKLIPAFIELVDIAGLVKGASKGEGVGNTFLGHIQDVDAIVHVVRCFEAGDVSHVEGDIDPLRDIEIIETELLLRDLEKTERAVQRLHKAVKTGDKEAKQKLQACELIYRALEKGEAARTVTREAPDIAPRIRELCLLTQKPVLFVANVDEHGLLEDTPHVEKVRAYAAARHAYTLTIAAKVEEEMLDFTPEETREMLAEFNMAEPGLHTLARSIYDMLGLQTFFTYGPDENRAWTIKKGMKAPQAGGVIHSDFERGFIKADVVTLEDLETYKTEAKLREHGRISQQGKDYVVRDGDIITFKFNV
jgi:hypothetical protein